MRKKSPSRKDWMVFNPLEKPVNKMVPVQVGVCSSRQMTALPWALWAWCINWMKSKLCLTSDLACCHLQPLCAHCWPHRPGTMFSTSSSASSAVPLTGWGCAGKPPWGGLAHNFKTLGLYVPLAFPQFPHPLVSYCVLPRGEVSIRAPDLKVRLNE